MQKSEMLTSYKNIHSHMTVLLTSGAYRMSRTVDVDDTWFADNAVKAAVCNITRYPARVSELQRRNRWCDTFTDVAQNFLAPHAHKLPIRSPVS